MNFINDNKIKGIIVLTVCVILIAQAMSILIYGSEELQKLFLLEMFGIFSIMIGYYFGSSKSSQDKDKTKRDEINSKDNI